jgi:hypothetical protein
MSIDFVTEVSPDFLRVILMRNPISNIII